VGGIAKSNADGVDGKTGWRRNWRLIAVKSDITERDRPPATPMWVPPRALVGAGTGP